jgi:cation diffusion facilitator family transporter
MTAHADRPAHASVALKGIVLNTVLAAIKAAAGFLGNSYALIADAVESAVDIVESVVVYGGIRIGAIPPDDDHPYGHGKAEPLAALIVAIALMSAAFGIAIASIREIHTPHHMPAPFTLVVLVGVVIGKEAFARFAKRKAREAGSSALDAEAGHHRSDAITSAAAFVGISVAIIGGPGYEMADDYAALFAAFLIGYQCYRIGRPALQEIMDAAPADGADTAVRSTAAACDGVIGIDHCLVRKVGSRLYVDLHIAVDPTHTVRRGHEIAHAVKNRLRLSNPRIADVLVHVEPAGDAPIGGDH